MKTAQIILLILAMVFSLMAASAANRAQNSEAIRWLAIALFLAALAVLLILNVVPGLHS